MELIYILLIGMSYFMVKSTKIKTENPLKTFAILLFVVGSVLSLVGTENHMIEVGAFFHILANITTTYFRQKNGRKGDRKEFKPTGNEVINER